MKKVKMQSSQIMLALQKNNKGYQIVDENSINFK